jgi:hypothetical protein
VELDILYKEDFFLVYEWWVLRGIAQDIIKQMKAAGGEVIDADDESIEEEL